MLSGWGSLAGAAAIIWAANKAADTLDEWKEKRATEREEDHAQECLVAVFEVTEALESVRAPLLHGSELARAEQDLASDPRWDDLTEQERGRHITGQVYINRMKYFEDRFDRLSNCIPLARALFGEAVSSAIAVLHRQQWIIRVEVESQIDDRGENPDFTIQLRNNLNDWKCAGDGKVSQAIRESVKAVEDQLLPVLRPKRRG